MSLIRSASVIPNKTKNVSFVNGRSSGDRRTKFSATSGTPGSTNNLCNSQTSLSINSKSETAKTFITTKPDYPQAKRKSKNPLKEANK